jgi:anti-anti-sigma regulatory factor
MAEKLRATVESEGDTSVVKLVGFLDEENKLKRLVEKIPAGTAMIDLAGVERINSNGIRDWVNWMSALERNGTRPVLVSCSPAIVAQINLVKNFTGHGAVKSFQVPYHCRECDEDKVILVETSEMSSPGAPPPTVRCESCDRDMDVDEMPESYFAFLGQVHLEELARGSMSSVVKSRVKTRRGSAPARQSQPSLSAYQTPAQGTPRLSSQDLLGKKRPSAPRIALGSSNRISGSTLPPETYERTPGTVTPKSYTMLLIAIIGVLLAGIAALSYVVFVQ